jgi:hypothetical protein
MLSSGGGVPAESRCVPGAGDLSTAFPPLFLVALGDTVKNARLQHSLRKCKKATEAEPKRLE